MNTVDKQFQYLKIDPTSNFTPCPRLTITSLLESILNNY
jgi:hypothetical protein